MTYRNDHLLLMALPFASRNDASDPAPAPPGAGSPPTCAGLFCDKPATDGDLCAKCADLMSDLRSEYLDLQAEYEDGWTDR